MCISSLLAKTSNNWTQLVQTATLCNTLALATKGLDTVTDPQVFGVVLKPSFVAAILDCSLRLDCLNLQNSSESSLLSHGYFHLCYRFPSLVAVSVRVPSDLANVVRGVTRNCIIQLWGLDVWSLGSCLQAAWWNVKSRMAVQSDRCTWNRGIESRLEAMSVS